MLLVHGHGFLHTHSQLFKAHALIPFYKAVLTEKLNIELVNACLAVFHQPPYNLGADAVPAVIVPYADTAHNSGNKSVGSNSAQTYELVAVIGIYGVEAGVCLCNILICISGKLVPFQ